MEPHEEFDFGHWARLAREDPSRFEQERARRIGEMIETAPPALRPRLEALQWKVEQVRRRARSPLAACLQVSRMMWERLLGEHGLLEQIQAVSEGRGAPGRGARVRSAQVIAFPPAARTPGTRPPDTTPPDDH